MLRGVLLVSVFASVSYADVSEPTSEYGDPPVFDKSFAPPSSIHPLDQPAQPDRGPTEIVHTSYRDQTLIADGLSVALTLGVYALPNDNLGGTSLAAGMLGVLATPIIHGVHGHGMRAVASYLLRSGTISVAMVAALETCPMNGTLADLNCLDRVPAGIAVGTIAAAAIDAAFLTDETVERPVRDGHEWTPIIQPQTGGASFGVAARF
ncbi:MAG: hypothetical protein QM831_17220 [Kofleriaceae bacterium]